MLKPSIPLKSKIELAIRRIEAQIQYLESVLNRFSDRDKYLFSKVVEKGWELLELRREALDLERIFRRLTIEGGEK